MTYLVNQAIFILINTLNAGKDAISVRNGKKIDHFVNGLIYFVFIFNFILIFKMGLVEAAIFAIGCFCNRQLSFDIPLNLLRKLKWYYVSPDPESKIDKAEVFLFGHNGKLPVYLYACIFVVTILINLFVKL